MVGHVAHATERVRRSSAVLPLYDARTTRPGEDHGMGTTTIAQEADPRDLGLCPDRLARIGTHFRRYVDDGLLPGWSFALARRGQVVHLDVAGSRDLASGAPMELDTIVRIFSMTKPITAVAALMLHEEGAFELTDPVSRFIPALDAARVWRSGSVTRPVTEPVTETMRIWHLFSHTAGFTYGFMYAHPVDELYRRAGFEWSAPKDADLAEMCDRWAALPLLFQPGSEWNAVSTMPSGSRIRSVTKRSSDIPEATSTTRPSTSVATP
jgi:CubicO group peptidase (beta-lactamase class C family)